METRYKIKEKNKSTSQCVQAKEKNDFFRDLFIDS